MYIYIYTYICIHCIVFFEIEQTTPKHHGIDAEHTHAYTHANIHTYIHATSKHQCIMFK